MRKQAGRRRSEAGFTLIEMLVAVFLMAGILTALVNVTAQWLPNWNRGFTRVQQSQLFGSGIDRLIADLSAAEFVTANGKAARPLFDGDELGVRLVRMAIGPNTPPGLEVIRISTTSDNRGLALVRDRMRYEPLPENVQIRDLTNFTDPVVIMRSPYLATFSYAGPDHVWRNSWHDAEKLPLAIRVSVRDAATQRSLAVSTATLLRVNAPAECVNAEQMTKCFSPSSPATAAEERK